MNYVLEYQQTDGKLRAIEKELNNSAERIRYKKLAENLKSAEDTVRKMEIKTNELNIMLTNLEKKLQSSKLSMNEFASNVDHCIDLQELEYLTKKVSDLGKTVNGYEKEINAVTVQIEDMSKKYDNFRQNYPTAKKQTDDARTAFRTLLSTRQAEMDELKKQLEQLEGKIQPEIIEEYKKLKNQGIFPPFVPLIGANQCGGCSMEIPSAQVFTLNEKGLLKCENCRRIVYINK
ncbi:MAG: hypothetical protein PHW00_04220 [Clostridia bacterium]|nr:hypothetical protein [Clostridia bacterium]